MPNNQCSQLLFLPLRRKTFRFSGKNSAASRRNCTDPFFAQKNNVPTAKKRFEEKGTFLLSADSVCPRRHYNEPEFGERKSFLSSLSAGKRSGKEGNFSCFRTRKTLFFPPPSLATTNVRKIPQDYISFPPKKNLSKNLPWPCFRSKRLFLCGKALDAELSSPPPPPPPRSCSLERELCALVALI